MTITESPLDVATAIGEAAAALLPADSAWTVMADDAGLPGGSMAAVGTRAGDHVIAIVVTADMSRRIQVGPPPADGLIDGLAPVTAAIAELLSLGTPEPLTQMNPQAIAAETPDHAYVCELRDGDEHLVSIVVTPPAPARTEAEVTTFQPIVGTAANAGASGLDVLADVELAVTVELGRTSMQVRDILSLVPGSVIELDRAASAPVDVLVNGTLIARGEVVVIDEEFGLRITEVVGHQRVDEMDDLAP